MRCGVTFATRPDATLVPKPIRQLVEVGDNPQRQIGGMPGATGAFGQPTPRRLTVADMDSAESRFYLTRAPHERKLVAGDAGIEVGGERDRHPVLRWCRCRRRPRLPRNSTRGSSVAARPTRVAMPASLTAAR